MLINSWSVSVKYMWGLPIQTHRCFIEPLGGIHAQSFIFTRFIKFLQSIRKGRKNAPYYLLEKIKGDTNTVTGRNIKHIFGNETIDIFDIDTTNMKKTIKLSKIEEKDYWKVATIKEIMDIKAGNLEVNFENGDKLKDDELEEFVNYIATV